MTFIPIGQSNIRSAILIFGTLVTSWNMAALSAETELQFDRDIRTILSKNCFSCHGPDSSKRKAQLRLDRQDGIFEKRDDHAIVVPGNSTQSALFQRLISEESSRRMPPVDSGKELTPQQIHLIRKWIDQGAPWQTHWSLTTPQRHSLPTVTQKDWPRNSIDYFVLAQLEKIGLPPSPEADRRSLIRRLYLDLTGLPPESHQVEAFVNDKSENAYGSLVEHLLDSPYYGEHMARYWLDIVRYGDTHGLHLDNYREMWPYRDWIVSAFNQNMPFDQFTIEQLAGDLLPDPTLQQQIASGFNRCNVTTSEGGSIKEEVYVRNVVDRVKAFGTIFMGLTTGCAVCHDHKYDPFSMKDFYQLFAFFNNIDGEPLDGNRKDHAPVVRVPQIEHQQQLQQLQKQKNQILSEQSIRAEGADKDCKQWILKTQILLQDNSPLLIGLLGHYPIDKRDTPELINLVNPEQKIPFHGSTSWTTGISRDAIQLGKEGFANLGDIGNFERTQPFSLGAWIKTNGNQEGSLIARIDHEHGNRGYEFTVEKQKIGLNLIHLDLENTIQVKTKENILSPDSWTHVFVTYDGSRSAQGVRFFSNGQPVSSEIQKDQLRGTTINQVPLTLGGRGDGTASFEGEIDQLRIYGRSVPESLISQLANLDPVREILEIKAEQHTRDQFATLKKLFLERIDTRYIELVNELQTIDKREKEVTSRIPTTLVFREQSELRPAYILVRGQYDQKGDPVFRESPYALPPMNSELPRNRLGLAKWLLTEEHPLMARVTVNRFWQQCFGRGLVNTSEDFGIQGERPSHPQLLDWLALEFREKGWNIKSLMRLFLTSATYRQSSDTNRQQQNLDPENKLLSRAPRFRLDAEVLRDQALAISGLLIRKSGGPSVKPPQPKGIWNAVGYTASDTANFKADVGDNIYRRSVYTFWKRTAPPPTMNLFDAPSRESCSIRRERTNTPLQALAMLNEVQFFEAARHLAEQSIRNGGVSEQQTLIYMFHRATSRFPNAQEIEALFSLYQSNLTEFQSDSESALAIVSSGQLPPDKTLETASLASWTMVANVLLNLDEVVTRN